MASNTMEGKVAVVTGGGRGIGRAIALLMAARGAKVVVNDVGVSVHGEAGAEKPADEVVALIKAQGGEAVVNEDSVAEAQSAQRIVETALDVYGGIDCVVNNAGILRDRIFHQMTADEWEAVLKVHLFGSFYVSRAAAGRFREQQRGTFVHMTSTSGLIGNFGQVNYAAAKLGMTALSKSIALDMARYNVRSNCIAPFATGRMGDTVPRNEAEQAARAEKAKNMTPDTIAPLAVFLASDASEGVTGQIFAMRGHEISLMSQPRPVRSVHCSEGWSPESLATHMLPALRPSLVPLHRTRDVFAWDPV